MACPDGLRATGVVLLVVAFGRLALNQGVFAYHVRDAQQLEAAVHKALKYYEQAHDQLFATDAAKKQGEQA